MAGPSVIGALRVVLGADTAALDKGLKEARGSLAGFATQAKNLGLLAAGAIAGVAGGTAVAIRSALTEADKLGKAAQSIGIPVDELSKLKHAADLSDVSLESLSTSMVRLSKNMVEVAGGGTGPASEAFKALGITVKNTDGTLKSSSDVLSEVAAKFASYEDGAAKTAIAVALFGKAGASMIPLLNAGATGLNEAKKEAEDLGLVIDQKTAAAAERFNDNLTRLGKVTEGVTIKVMAGMADSLAELSDQFVESAKNADSLSYAMKGLEIGAKVIASAVLGAVYAYKQFAHYIGVVVDVARKIGAGEFTAAFDAAKEGMSGIADTAVSTGTALRNIWMPSPQWAEWRSELQASNNAITEALRLGEQFTNQKTQAPTIGTGSKNALQSFIESQQKATQQRLAEASAVGLQAGALEKLKVIQQAELLAKQNNLAITPLMNAKIQETALAAEQAALKLQGMNLIQSALEPHELYRQELEKNRLALQAVGATAEQVAAVQQKTAENYGATWEQVIPGAIGGFNQLASEFSKTNSKMAKGAQALAVVEALINTYVGFTKALATIPPPLNYAAAAGVLAAGMAKVMAIKSQSVPSVSAFTGASFMVPGSGGPDSRSYMMNLSPGEQVDVWRPGEGTGDPRGGGAAAQEITVNIADRFLRDFWARGIEQINELAADGYRLKIA